MTRITTHCCDLYSNVPLSRAAVALQVAQATGCEIILVYPARWGDDLENVDPDYVSIYKVSGNWPAFAYSPLWGDGREAMLATAQRLGAL